MIENPQAQKRYLWFIFRLVPFWLGLTLLTSAWGSSFGLGRLFTIQVEGFYDTAALFSGALMVFSAFARSNMRVRMAAAAISAATWLARALLFASELSSDNPPGVNTTLIYRIFVVISLVIATTLWAMTADYITIKDEASERHG